MTIRIFCQSCRTHLYTYQKRGKGALVKCFAHKITFDATTSLCTCPTCASVFCRPTIIKGRPANKIVRGKVYVKG